MKTQLFLGAVLVALAGCSPAPVVDETAVAGDAPAAKRMPLPECATVEAQDAGVDGWKHPDCRMMFPDQSGLAIEARYSPAEDEATKVSLQVVAPGDATLQTIEEVMGFTFNGPTLEDFDKDGKIDILLPLETGNVNTTWAVWRQSAENTFVKVGEPSGVGLAKTESGYIAAPGRSSANMWDVDFYKLDADALKLVATATVAAEGEADKITGVTCEVTEGVAFALAGMTPEAAKAAFCAEPAAAEIFK